MRDLIDRQAAIYALDTVEIPKNATWYTFYRKAVTALNNLPPAQPEIIRCKDCKHWIPYDWMFSEVWQSKNMADYPEDDIGCDCCDMAMKVDDFCSRAKRRTDG